MSKASGYDAADDQERAMLAVQSILPPDELDDYYCSSKQDLSESGSLGENHSNPKRQIDYALDESLTKKLHREVDETDLEEAHLQIKPDLEDEGDSYKNTYVNLKFYKEGSEVSSDSKIKEEAEASKVAESQPLSSQSETLCDVVAAHYNNVPESGLSERNKSRILYLRNFNNWIKSMLIDEFITKVREEKKQGSNLKVLDIGCGKGGDLFKWRQGKISHLVCTDIAATSVDQCKGRYNDMKQRAHAERTFSAIFSAEFIVANSTKERLREHYKDVTMQLDLVSCQFAFHYCFESLPQAECMMRNAAECLRPGGYFFGTCPNANAIVSRARKSGGKEFGNDVFSVKFDSPMDDTTPPPLFGARYNFHMEGVVDCPEFLVHFPTFIRLASKYGLDFVCCEPFHSFFDRKKEEGRGLLGKMQALESYPPFPDQPLMGPQSEYQHADAFIQENENGPSQRLGTLSKSEWEATTLYLIFVFKKVR